jgi:hypothetical protein
MVLACLPGVAAAALDLRQATMDRLDNGLELIVLEEHSLPVVSVQMLYRAGACDEQYGRTGLAHYLEHMAFRATENFPATQVTTRISGVGGESGRFLFSDRVLRPASPPEPLRRAVAERDVRHAAMVSERLHSGERRVRYLLMTTPVPRPRVAPKTLETLTRRGHQPIGM